MAPSPSIQVFSDTLFLQELHRRLTSGAIRLDLGIVNEDWAKINIVSTGREPSSFEVMAYPPPIAHL